METKSLSESTICCFGDSTTWGDNGCGGGGNDISWTSHLGALLGGAVIENFGIKGSRIAIKADRSDSFVERLDGIGNAADIYIVFGARVLWCTRLPDPHHHGAFAPGKACVYDAVQDER